MTEIVREWSGTAERVHQALELAHARGQLVSVVPLRANARGVVVRVVLTDLELSPPAAATGQRRTAGGRRGWEYRAAAGLALLGAAALGVWLLVEAVAMAWAWFLGHIAQLVGALVVIAVVFWALGRLGVCLGVHCPGCRHSG